MRTLTTGERVELNGYIESHAQMTPRVRTVEFLALALCGEAGELANIFKKAWRAGLPFSREDVRKELADIANYADMLAFALDIDLELAQFEKFREVEQRSDFKTWKGGQ